MSSQFYKLRIYTKQKETDTPFLVVSSGTRIDEDGDKGRKVINALPLDDAYGSVQLMLSRLEYDKTLFSPCSAVAEITVDKGSVDRTAVINALKSCFKDKSVDIILSGRDDVDADSADFCIGRDYIIFSAQPCYKSDDTAFSVTLHLFSRDKLLTLDKFSKCYLNKRLGQDIIAGSLDSEKFLKRCDIGCDVAVNRLQFLSSKTASGTSAELIQPYRVQYNEDFYSFISRIACICGEFLFFEDGKLCLGLPQYNDQSVTVLEDGKHILSIEYPQMFDSPLSVQSFYNEYHTGKKDDGDAGGGDDEKNVAKKKMPLMFNEESAYDEYFDVFDSSEKPDSFVKETLFGPYIKALIKGIAPALFSDLKSGRTWLGVEGLVNAGLDMSKAALEAETAALYVNDKYDKAVFAKPGDNTDAFNESLQKDGTKLSQFASVSGFDQLMSYCITSTREREKKASGDTIRLKVKAGTGCKVRLGDYVRLNDETEVYVVTKVSGTSQVKKTRERGSVIDVFSLEDSQSVELVPKEGTAYYPPYNSCAEPVRVSSQTAIIADADDPRYMGRVRLKYPWQPESDKASPWVRFVAPMASKSGARAHFKLFKGDEVMVDYQGGNVERPYVIGALFNSEAKPDSYLYNPHDRTIRSQNGEVINFKAGNYDKYMTDMVPVWGAVSSFIPWVTRSFIGAGLDEKIPAASAFHGSLTLSDTYGLWTIEGDTAGRQITIDSMAGKVTISALTGISISTCGDLDLYAKNINIKAENNIDIESGIAIKNARIKEKTKEVSGFKNVAKEVTKGLVTDLIAGKVDFTILRTIAELILGPMEGTLRIKSNRYLNLEAGEGRSFDVDASDPKNSFVSKADRRQLEESAYSLETFGTQIVADIRAIRSICNGYFDVDFLHSSLTSLSGKYRALKAALKKSKKKCNIGDLIDDADDGKKAETVECLGDASDLDEASKDAAKAFYEDCLAFFNTLEEKYGELEAEDFEKSYPGVVSSLQSAVSSWYDQLRREENIRTIPNKEEMFKNAKAARRNQYRDYIKNKLSNRNFSSLSTAIGDAEWEEAVRGLYIKKSGVTKGLDEMIADKFRKNGWSFVDYEKYGSEYYIKNPTAKGRILFSQEAGRTYQIQKDGTLHPSPINETLRNIQRALMEDENFDTVD